MHDLGTLRFRIPGSEEIMDSQNPSSNLVDVLIETGRQITPNDTVFLVGYPAGDYLENPRLIDTDPLQIDRLDFEIEDSLIVSTASLTTGRVYVAAIGTEPAVEHSSHSEPQLYSGDSTLILRFESPNIEIAEIRATSRIESPVALENPNSSESRLWLLGLSVLGLSSFVGFWIIRRRSR